MIGPLASGTGTPLGSPCWLARWTLAGRPAPPAVTAAAGCRPLASTTARAPTNASPAPTVSTAVTRNPGTAAVPDGPASTAPARSEEHTSELQSHVNLVCRLLLEK